LHYSETHLMILALALILVASIPSSMAGQRPPPLRTSDFLLHRIPDDADTSVVRHVLGAPDSISTGDDPSQASDNLPTWWYRDLHIVFADGRHVHGWWITGPSRATQRGLRVGAPRGDIQRLYGPPTLSSGDSTFTYREPRGGSHPRLIFIWVAAGRVRDLYIGRLID